MKVRLLQCAATMLLEYQYGRLLAYSADNAYYALHENEPRPRARHGQLQLAMRTTIFDSLNTDLKKVDT